MADDKNLNNNDPFGGGPGGFDPFGSDPFTPANDTTAIGNPFDAQQTVTPVFNSIPTSGTKKLLVIVFVIDTSKSMEGAPIEAVNAALSEVMYDLKQLKKNQNLDIQAAIMSFTSTFKWELNLTDVDEIVLDTLRVRPGLTQYGAAFHELDRVLRKENFMQHVGKVAPPAILFMTDGEPGDDYQADLDDLLKNGWFANSSRSAVLMGDALYNDAAKNAVSQFVNDTVNDIVGASDTSKIVNAIKLATMHTVQGDPINKGGDAGTGTAPSPAPSPTPDPTPAPAPGTVPGGTSSTTGTSPFPPDTPSTVPGPGTTGTPAIPDDPFAFDPNNPFGKGNTQTPDTNSTGSSAAPAQPDPVKPAVPVNDPPVNPDPFGSTGSTVQSNMSDTGISDPFGSIGGAAQNNVPDMGNNDPFGGSSAKGFDPFASNGSDPFASGTNDPFASGGNDPFASSGGNDPFSAL